MNWLFLIVLLVLIIEVVVSAQRGFVKEVVSFVSLIFISALLLLGVKILNSYFNNNLIGVILAIVLLVLLFALYFLIKTVLLPAKLIAKLPIIKGVDKVLGVVAGALETLIFLWTLYSIVMFVDTGMVGQAILECVQTNPILNWCFNNNLLASLVEGIIK